MLLGSVSSPNCNLSAFSLMLLIRVIISCFTSFPVTFQQFSKLAQISLLLTSKFLQGASACSSLSNLISETFAEP
jgi:hypothetical protein